MESWIAQTEGPIEIFGSMYMQRTANGMGVKIDELPSPSRGITSRSWTLPDLGFSFEDFTYDAAQDLLVVVRKEYAPSGSCNLLPDLSAGHI